MKTDSDLFEDVLIDNALLVMPDQGEKIESHGISINFKVTGETTNDQIGVYEICLAPKTIGAKVHYHRFMDETFIIQEGKVTLSLGERNIVAEKGAVAHIPRFTPHGFRNDSDKAAKLLLIFNPAQNRENFFRELHETLKERPVDPRKFLKLYEEYDSFPLDMNNMIQVE
ncbi:cupin domain-containing protein [Poritiphilus flavus]|uniref:Cupin domain-containing protein n=1 Tax=Poritiphilus flavus TaxID=2697053 RepID=A0A6L9E9V5_9FLAO|nr:cupin domain-containing protein [Poritiphilus flavus]NAS11433.1 cupin domain-containing protein [Poritiphilus flavus]